MVAEIEQEIQPSPVVAIFLRVWHFSDTAVKVELRANTNSYGSGRRISKVYIATIK